MWPQGPVGQEFPTEPTAQEPFFLPSPPGFWGRGVGGEGQSAWRTHAGQSRGGCEWACAGRPPHPQPFSPSKAEGEGRKKVVGFAWMVAVTDEQPNAMRCDDATFIPCIPSTAQRRQTGCTGSAG